MSRVCVVGFGKVGSALVASYLRKGFEVDVIEKNPELSTELIQNKWASTEPEVAEVINKFHSKIRINCPQEAVRDCEYFLLIVPTPSRPDGSFDNTFIFEAIDGLISEKPEVQKRRTIVIKSTVSPGACEIIQKRIKERAAEGQWGLVYNPEFIALGSVMRDIAHPNVLLIGSEDKVQAEEFAELVKRVGNPKASHFLPLPAAEIAKISINTFVTAKISFANLIGELASAQGVEDTNELLECIGSDPRIGTSYLKPGLGFGGPCFPRDNRALSNALQEMDLDDSLPNSVDRVNDAVPIKKLNRIKQLGVQNILFIGLAYKPGSDFYSVSQAAFIATELSRKGMSITAFDPLVNGDDFDFPVIRTLPQGADEFEAVVLAVADDDLTTQVLASFSSIPILVL